MTIVLHENRSVALPKKTSVFDDLGVVGRIGIPSPLQIAQPASVRGIVAVAVRSRCECLPDIVGEDGHYSAHSARTQD